MDRRHGRLTLGMLVYAAWAAALALGGLRAISMAGMRTIPSLPGWVWVVGGIAMLGMAQLVFSALVADRLFPHANPWLSGLVQLLAGVVFVGGWTVLLLGVAL